MKRCTVLTIALLAVLSGAASAQIHLELMSEPRQDIPPNGSTWHELFPNYCVVHTQDEVEDNGDGILSPCDFITLGGERLHITWVGPTYHLVQTSSGDRMDAEPTNPEPGGDPYCEVWFEVYPDHGLEWHVEGWEDNGDGVVSVCDMVMIGGAWWHIENIGLNIIVEPGGSPVEQSTWGVIKAFFQRLF